jgi:hypothetical protein
MMFIVKKGLFIRNIVNNVQNDNEVYDLKKSLYSADGITVAVVSMIVPLLRMCFWL